MSMRGIDTWKEHDPDWDRAGWKDDEPDYSECGPCRDGAHSLCFGKTISYERGYRMTMTCDCKNRGHK